MFEELDRKEKIRESIRKSMINYIPEDYTELYPEARKIHRHFILNLGETNSGKTYEAVKKLENTKKGVYLAPLRLLAYEQYERILKDTGHCTMLTGEEKILDKNASIVSSTVEMVDIYQKYDIAVIDEVQMISDRSRGGAWLKALVGLQADTIYLCGSDNVKTLLLKIIQDCGDTYEINDFHRKTELNFEDRMFSFPEDVQKGDALIAFSRKSVSYIAGDLKKAGINCSLIYGALPYSVRHEQAEAFASGKNDVVVATDAIGMGMNLPIRRIIFMETKKFDGFEQRALKSFEVKQIAGRAGRLGQYNKGLVNSEENRKSIKKKLYSKESSLNTISVDFPETLLGIDAKFSDILEQWNDFSFKQDWIKKADTAQLLSLTKEAEKTNLGKLDVFRIANIPFDASNDLLHTVWKKCLYQISNGENINCMNLYEDYKIFAIGDFLAKSEKMYRLCDLLYFLSERFVEGKYSDALIAEKKEISKNISSELEKHPYHQKECKYCHKPLPWNYSYGMCEECHRKMYGRRSYYYDDIEDYIDGFDF